MFSASTPSIGKRSGASSRSLAANALSGSDA
jgi:hypothetical protein